MVGAVADGVRIGLRQHLPPIAASLKKLQLPTQILTVLDGMLPMGFVLPQLFLPQFY